MRIRLSSAVDLVGVLALTTILAAPATAQTVGGHWETLASLGGLGAGDRLGSSVAGATDIDGDGVDDLILGAELADPMGRFNAGSVYVLSGRNGALLWRFNGREDSDVVGSSVSGIGDLNGDGFDDVIIGARAADPNGLSAAGSVYVVSGATGNSFHRIDGQSWGAYLGTSAARTGDIDLDGMEDFIVGAPGDSPGGINNTGSAYVYSGATGSLIWRFDGQAANDQLGTSVSGAGDVDGDGVNDFIVGAKGALSIGPGSSPGSAFVYSGATGNLLWRFDGQSNDHLGSTVSTAGDVDGDGRSDLMVGAPGASPGGLSYGGSVYVYSGASGALIRQFDGLASGESLGSSLSECGDLDSDGIDDLLIGAAGASPGGLVGAGSIFAYSGGTGVLLQQFDGEAAGDRLSVVSPAGDINQDGIPDLIVGAREADVGGLTDSGSVRVFSLNPLLRLQETEISVSAGLPVQAELSFPMSESGQRYVILISATGAGPSMVGGLLVPLTPDTTFNHWFGNSQFVGTLDANARAAHQLHLPPGTPTSAIGSTLYLAAVSFDSLTQLGRVSSMVRHLTIVP